MLYLQEFFPCKAIFPSFLCLFSSLPLLFALPLRFFPWNLFPSLLHLSPFCLFPSLIDPSALLGCIQKPQCRKLPIMPLSNPFSCWPFKSPHSHVNFNNIAKPIVCNKVNINTCNSTAGT